MNHFWRKKWHVTRIEKIWIHKVAIIFFAPLPQQPMFLGDLSCKHLGIGYSH